MVLQKRLDYGSSGYQVPAMPHFPTSAKGKRSIRKKVDSQMCPFDLLATVAGQLLSERENSVLFPQCINGTSNATNTRRVTIEEEQVCKRDPFKTEAFHEQSCNDNALGPEIIAKGQITCGLKEHSQASGPADSGPASLLIKSDISDATTGELMNINDRAQIGYPANAVAGTGGIRRNPPAFAKVQGEGMTRPPEYENQSPGNGLELNALHMYSLEVPMDLDARPPASISSDSSAGVPVCRNYVPGTSSLPKHESGLELVVDRDDDDNSSGCTHPGNITNQASRPQYIGDHGVRKLSTSKYWKADPSTLKYSEVSNYDVKTKHGFCGKKICYTRQRTQRSYFKRRKLFEHHSVSASTGGIFSEDISNLCEKIAVNVEAHDPHATVHTTVVSADGASSSKIGQNSSFDSVKLSIKSFKVPELFIEIPESATVGSLKRTVMEAVTAILQGGLHVGVLLQGKKVRDDNATLRQAGISHSDKLDNLGFTLEPSLSRTPPPLTSTGDPHFLCIGDAVEPLARIPPIAHSVDWEACDTSPQPALTSCPESDHDSVHSPTDASSLDQTRANSRALVALPAVSVEALAVVPLRKPRRPEHVQRRIRRPFSVTEAEALVQAVEKIGTGRWRDVKLRAFDNAKHRTYVDLKDKWKTLVHTARISPQQRRGEPVPQELLDRVLSAQAYWSQRQAKLHVRPPADDETCLLL